MNKRAKLAAAVFLGAIACAGLFLLPRATPEKGREFTDNEIAVLSIRKSDPTGKKNNRELIMRTAQATRTVSIRDCVLDPVVPKLAVGEEFELRNDDQVPRVIETDRNHVFQVPAGGSIRTIADFGFGKGLYGCQCDTNTVLCGILWVD